MNLCTIGFYLPVSQLKCLSIPDTKFMPNLPGARGGPVNYSPRWHLRIFSLLGRPSRPSFPRHCKQLSIALTRDDRGRLALWQLDFISSLSNECCDDSTFFIERYPRICRCTRSLLHCSALERKRVRVQMPRHRFRIQVPQGIVFASCEFWDAEMVAC
jgi:hypothetical protein